MVLERLISIFLHQKSGVKSAVPLLSVHGWPGSLLEVTRMLPLLKGGEGRRAFHVVAPSLPNYAFRGGVKEVSLFLGSGMERDRFGGHDEGEVLSDD